MHKIIKTIKGGKEIEKNPRKIYSRELHYAIKCLIEKYYILSEKLVNVRCELIYRYLLFASNIDR